MLTVILKKFFLQEFLCFLSSHERVCFSQLIEPMDRIIYYSESESFSLYYIDVLNIILDVYIDRCWPY